MTFQGRTEFSGGNVYTVKCCEKLKRNENGGGGEEGDEGGQGPTALTIRKLLETIKSSTVGQKLGVAFN